MRLDAIARAMGARRRQGIQRARLKGGLPVRRHSESATRPSGDQARRRPWSLRAAGKRFAVRSVWHREDSAGHCLPHSHRT